MLLGGYRFSAAQVTTILGGNFGSHVGGENTPVVLENMQQLGFSSGQITTILGGDFGSVVNNTGANEAIQELIDVFTNNMIRGAEHVSDDMISSIITTMLCRSFGRRIVTDGPVTLRLFATNGNLNLIDIGSILGSRTFGYLAFEDTMDFIETAILLVGNQRTLQDRIGNISNRDLFSFVSRLITGRGGRHIMRPLYSNDIRFFIDGFVRDYDDFVFIVHFFRSYRTENWFRSIMESMLSYNVRVRAHAFFVPLITMRDVLFILVMSLSNYRDFNNVIYMNTVVRFRSVNSTAQMNQAFNRTFIYPNIDSIIAYVLVEHLEQTVDSIDTSSGDSIDQDDQ